ncbi:MAG: DUF1015 domain-containing protein [Bilifractor sp.]
MAMIRPFRALTPAADKAKQVAALPYDVYNRAEARKVVEQNPLSFLSIDRAETQFPEEQDMYAPCVYEKAASMLQSWQDSGILEEDSRPCYYIWELIMNGRSQKGLVACSSVDDYLDGVIRKHETTRKEKEKDRFDHIDTCSAQTGPIFLAYRAHPEVSSLIRKESAGDPVLAFTADDGVEHRVWRITNSASIDALTRAFAGIDHTYIADGHHRAASAVSVSQKRRQEHPDYSGDEEFNYFLSVLFPDDELKIMDYNRVLRDLNGYEPDEILEKLDQVFRLAEAPDAPYRPAKKGEMGFYLEGKWYRLQTREHLQKTDPIRCLDVDYLQREALGPIWNIQDPRTDSRIDFVGGIRGLSELERRCHEDCEAAFAMYPTSIQELFAVADAGLLMPPKSTWFEPKLRSGLFIHKIER